MASFESPVLPVSEILEAFKSMGINVSDNDFKSPDFRRWHDIYAQMFECLLLKPVEQVIQSLFRVQRLQTTHHELNEEGFAQMSFTCCLKRMFNHCGFDSFSLNDVINPAPKRVKQLASVFINAKRHNEKIMGSFEEIRERLVKSKGQFESVVNRNAFYKEKLEEARLKQESKQAEAQRLQQEDDQSNQQLIDLRKKVDEVKRHHDEIKLKNAELKNEKELLKQTIVSTQQESEKLSQKIVPSPTQFRTQQERYTKMVMDLKTELQRKEQVLSESRLLLEQTVNKQTVAEKAVKLTKESQSDLEKISEVDREIHQLLEKQHECQENMSRCCKTEEDLTEQLSVRQEMRHKTGSQIDLNEQSKLQQIAGLKELQEKYRANLKKIKAETSQVFEKVTANKGEVAELEKDKENIRMEGQAEFKQAVEEMTAIDKLLATGWEDFKQIMLEKDD